MTNLSLDAARAANASTHRKPDSVWVAVPRVPSLGMMRAAIAAPDAVRPGDRIGDWIGTDPDDGWTAASIHPSLVDRFGVEESLRLCVALDAWTGALGGLDEWIRVRGLEGSTPYGEGWLRPMVDRCPPEGWPATKAEETDAHRAFASERGAPFVYQSSLPFWLKTDEDVVVAPVRAASIMGLRGAQADLGCMEWAHVEDMVLKKGMPFVTGRTPEGRHDDDERAWLVAAALWRGAVEHLLNGSDDDEPFPEHPDVQMFRLKNFVSDFAHAPAKASGIDVYRDGPWSSATISSSRGILRLEASGGMSSWRWEGSDGQGASASGIRFGARISTELLRSVRLAVSGDGTKVERTLPRRADETDRS